MSDTKVIGLEPVKYVKIAYILLLVSSGIGVLTTIMALAGVFTGLGGLANIAGILGVLMGIIGWAAFKDKFASLEINHLQYIVILFLAFVLIGIVFGAVFLMSPMALYGISLIFAVIQLLLYFTGYNSWQHGRAMSKDNIKSEIQAALNRS